MIYKCIDKALAGGVEAGLKDAYHCPRKIALIRNGIADAGLGGLAPLSQPRPRSLVVVA